MPEATSHISLTCAAGLRLAVKRATRDDGKLIITGNVASSEKDAPPPDVLEARLTGKSASGDLPGQWQPLPFDPRVAAFRGELIVAAGGWYRLEVRALRHGIVIGTSAVEHVGVGEVFVIAGQSNAANYGEELQHTQSGLVAAFSGANWQLAADPEPGAGGKRGSFMPLFGDALAARFQVPIRYCRLWPSGSTSACAGWLHGRRAP